MAYRTAYPAGDGSGRSMGVSEKGWTDISVTPSDGVCVPDRLDSAGHLVSYVLEEAET